MKKIALLLAIAAIGVMASGDVLAQRGRGGGHPGGGRPGGDYRMSRPAGGPTMQSRPAMDSTSSSRSTALGNPQMRSIQSTPRIAPPQHQNTQRFQSNQIQRFQGSVQRDTAASTGLRQLNPTQRSGAVNRINPVRRPTPGFASPTQRSGARSLTPAQRDTMKQWAGRGGGGKRPGYRPGYKPGYKPGYGGGGRYARHYPYHHYPYHHHRHHYPGWRPGWWTIPVAWGIGSAWWNWNTPDTYVYYNPYAVYVQDPIYDYSTPVYNSTDESLVGDEDDLSATESVATTEEADSATTQAAMEYFEAARTSFKDNNYQGALSKIDKAIEKLPQDAALHEFRGLVLFAEGKYNKAAAVINSVLASGPGWNWDTMIGLYKNPEEYTDQLRNLENFTRRHQKDAAAKFLLAYQYLVMGFTDNAATQLKDVVKLQPKDILAKRLLGMIEEAQKASTDSTPERPTPQE